MASGGDASSDDRVLSPDELDIEAQEDVASLGDGRYVIGADGPPAATGDTRDEDTSDRDTSRDTPEPADDAGDENGADRASADLSGREVKRWLGDELESHDSSYAYHIAAKADGSVTHQQLATDDIGAAFDGLLVWYARQVADGTPVDEALGVLLAASSVQIRYPTARLVAYLEQHDLGPDDSIRDLVAAVSEEDGLVFPPR